MEVQFTPEIEAQLDQLASETGRPQSEFVQDAMAVYLSELIPVRTMLDRRYNEIKSGNVQAISADEVFRRLREKSEALRSRQ